MDALIRQAGAGDADAVAGIYRPFVEASATSFEAVPPDAGGMARRITDTVPTHPWLVCELEGRVAGYAYAGKHRARTAYQWSVETSAYVDPAYHRRGVGRALYTSLLAVLRAQGFVNAYAGITLPNPASVAFHESMGFRPVGVFRGIGHKFGAWHDVGWWALELAPRDAPPRDPLSLEQVVGSEAWTSAMEAGVELLRRER